MSVIISKNAPNYVLDNWVKAINEQDINAIVQLYNNSAILIPALSSTANGIINIKEHFEPVLQKNGLTVEMGKCINTYENGLNINSGQYIFHWQEDGTNCYAKAQFSFIIHDDKIIVHHSSEWPVQ